jgi:hypothetical protein
MNLDYIYTPLEEAKKEIWKRWNDKELAKKVEKYLNGHIPHVLNDEPKAISTSHIATPNWAFLHFWMSSLKVGLKPVAFEYTEDKFVTTNYDKASLAKMIFYHGKDDNGKMLTSSKHAIDLTGKEEKKLIKEIKTLWGENFVDFHHRVLNSYYKDIEIHDGSDWYHKMGKNAEEYYKYVLALYIRNGILFENFSLVKSEGRFTREILIPAFEDVYREFGLKPLIVRIYADDEGDHKYWFYYPEFIKMMLK